MTLLPLNLNHRHLNHRHIIIYLHIKVKINPGLIDMPVSETFRRQVRHISNRNDNLIMDVLIYILHLI